LAQPSHRRGNAEQLLLPSCLHSERQITGSSCYNVTPFLENCCSTLFTTEFKRLAEGGHSFCFGLLLEAFIFAFGFWIWAFEVLALG
jgi:hypothetical protein